MARVDVGKRQAQRHGHERAGLDHRLGPGVVGHVGVAGAVHHRLGPDGHQPLLGGDDHAGDPVVLHDGVRRADVDQVAATSFVQGVEHRDLQVLHVAPEFMLADPDRLVAIGLQFLDQQFVNRRSRLAAGPHLVDGHAQGPSGDAAEKGVVFNQHGLRTLSCRAQGGPDARRSAADDQYIDFVECSVPHRRPDG